MYATLEEAEFRLHSTYVTYEGKLVFVSGVEAHADGVIRLRVQAPGEDNPTQRKKINSPHFRRFQTPALGYANYFSQGSTNASWVERMPVRRSKQGLDSTNVSITDVSTGYRHNFRAFMLSPAAAEMIENEYPSFEVAVNRLVAGSSIAVDREFALFCDESGFTFLDHKKTRIGLIFNNRIFLSARHRHMLETVAECPNLPNAIEVM